jgi:beta-ketodecanoyl-[acyl-carrier-protein] synthase
VIERAETASSDHQFDILGTQAKTVYSNNIRSNFGYMSRAYGTDPFGNDKLFHQEGRSVFKEVCPMAAEHLISHLALHGTKTKDVRRWWLHQANINMNQLISKKLLGRMPDADEAPIVLDRYANTASAGSVIALALHHQDLKSGDIGMLCSFGAGYSIGSLILQKL